MPEYSSLSEKAKKITIGGILQRAANIVRDKTKGELIENEPRIRDILKAANQ